MTPISIPLLFFPIFRKRKSFSIFFSSFFSSFFYFSKIFFPHLPFLPPANTMFSNFAKMSVRRFSDIAAKKVRIRHVFHICPTYPTNHAFARSRFWGCHLFLFCLTPHHSYCTLTNPRPPPTSYPSLPLVASSSTKSLTGVYTAHPACDFHVG